ncbi:hypothetical protein ABEB36_011225 [Hypothenemus hampei]|uniref:Uncharacterized protein n=1 Tax=Hypothenemus hampei TaxID=57062 RepID=A0ABD1EHH4_HYPHA
MKFLLEATFLACLVFAGANDIFECPESERRGTMICFADIGKFGEKDKVVEDVYICANNATLNPGLITCLIVHNSMGFNGGTAVIRAGGLGYDYVEIDMKSQVSYAFDFHIEAFVN